MGYYSAIKENEIMPFAATWMDLEMIKISQTKKYYSAIKENEIMAFAATWMDLENIRLSELSHVEKDKYQMISLLYGI